MTNATQEINGFAPGLQDWEATHWAEEDPTQYGDLAEDNSLILFGDWHEPHYIRGFDATELALGMRITTQSALTTAENWR